MTSEQIRRLALVGVVLGFGSAAVSALVAVLGPGGQPAPPVGRFETATREIAAFSFTDGAGQPVTLADFAGKPVLLNLWATWCAPCIKELPSLDRLQADLGGAGFQVVAVAEDRGGAKVVLPFLDKQGVKALAPYLDPPGAALRALGVQGLPTSILIGRDGRETARLLGGADWDSAAIRRQITELIRSR
ncbi:MAG: TlpA disulfide reductase family protein [Rhodospirillaceae bacterium]